MSYYYNVDDDINKYNAWIYIIVGGRNTGKTYSALKSCVTSGRKFVFIKRTIDDVDLLCAGSGRIGTKQNEFGVDLSPFKSINRDMHTNIKAFSIKNGLGGFWACDYETDAPSGHPIGYLISLSAVSKFKGFDLSECDWLIFDEFIPQPWDRINRKEGEQLMDLYKTVSRDREHRNKEPLKLLCLANATSISNPVTNILEITDTMADMQVKHENIRMDNERGIFIHIIGENKAFQEKEKQSQIYKAMGKTSWGRMAFNNEFAYNDFTNVGRVNMKGYKPITSYIYKGKQYYIYMKEGQYYATTSANNKTPVFDLSRENEQKRFWFEHVYELRNECIDGKMIFESYSMYDLIMNYKKIFNIN